MAFESLFVLQAFVAVLATAMFQHGVETTGGKVCTAEFAVGRFVEVHSVFVEGIG